MLTAAISHACRARERRKRSPDRNSRATARRAGISADPDATLRDIASRHDRHAPDLFALIKAVPQQ